MVNQKEKKTREEVLEEYGLTEEDIRDGFAYNGNVEESQNDRKVTGK